MRSAAPPLRPVFDRRMASMPSARRMCGRCARASDPPPRERPRSDTDVPRWTLRSVGRRWSRCRRRKWIGETRCIVCSRPRQTSEAIHENTSTIPHQCALSTADASKKMCTVSLCTGNAPSVHRFCTSFTFSWVASFERVGRHPHASGSRLPPLADVIARFARCARVPAWPQARPISVLSLDSLRTAHYA